MRELDYLNMSAPTLTIPANPSTWRRVLGGRDVVIISPQFWGDLWVSKHWIAYQLADYCRVLFVEPPLWLSGLARRPGTWSRDLPKLWQPLREVKKGLLIFRPRLHPRLSSRWAPAVPEQIRGVANRIGMRGPIVLNFDTNPKVVKALHGSVNVYYCVDPVMSAADDENDERTTCAESDLIYAVSEAYREQLAAYGTAKPIHVIPHGYAFEHARRIDEDPASVEPSELRALPKPILGFVGSIHDSYVDIERLERVARELPQASIVLIGPHKKNPIGPDLSQEGLARIRALPNVHLLGPRHFLEVPKYVKYFDVGLVLINTRDYDANAKTSKRTLFKWLLYLSMGKPAVAPMMSEASAINDIVYLSQDDAHYVRNIRAALREPGRLRALRIKYASQFSFDNMLDRLAEPMVPLLAKCSAALTSATG